MILMNDDTFTYYRHDLLSRLKVSLSMLRHDLGSETYRDLFTHSGVPHNPIDYGQPHSFPCLIETAISFQRSYKRDVMAENRDRSVLFVPTYNHVIITRNQAKVLVYPKSRKIHRYGLSVISSHGELIRDLNQFIELDRGAAKRSNAEEVKSKAEAGLYKFPILFANRAYYPTIAFDADQGGFALCDTHQAFMVFDSKDAKQLIYYKKGISNANVERPKKYVKAGFPGVARRPNDLR
jgi:hypothetical protein